MQLVMVKTGNNLVAPGQWEMKALDKYADGELVLVQFVKARNPAFLAKFWKMIRWAFENIEHEQPTEELLKQDLIILSGLAHKTIGMDGQIYYSPMKINFADMTDDAEFAQVYDAVLNTLVKIVGADANKLTNLINNYG